MLGMLQPLVSGVAATLRQVGLQYLTLHKAVAKLGYIVTSLLSGVMQEGFCTATEAEDSEAGEELVHLAVVTAESERVTCCVALPVMTACMGIECHMSERIV